MIRTRSADARRNARFAYPYRLTPIRRTRFTADHTERAELGQTKLQEQFFLIFAMSVLRLQFFTIFYLLTFFDRSAGYH